jgi:predicted DNA-binding transcriptional regulator AlpA
MNQNLIADPTSGLAALVAAAARIVSEHSAAPGLTGFDELPDAAFLRLPTVCALLSRSPASIWRDVRDGRMPKPSKLGARAIGWPAGQIRALLAQRAGGA